MTTYYARVAYDPQSGLLDTNDVTCAETVGGPLIDQARGFVERNTFHYAALGRADTNNHGEEPHASAVIDLRGTPWSFDPATKWETTGFRPEGGADGPSAVNNFKLVSVWAGQECATWASHGIRVVADKAKPPAS